MEKSNDALSDLGFSESELDLYFALLRIGEGTISDCTKLSRLRRTAAYATMRKLVELGLVAEVAAKPVRFRALPPKIALTELLNEKLRDVQEKHRKHLEDLQRKIEEEIAYIEKRLPRVVDEIISKAQALYSKGSVSIEADREIVILRGSKAVFDALHHIKVQKVTRIISRPPILIPLNEKLGYEENKLAARKGIERRLLFETGMLEMPEFKRALEIHLETGHPARHLPELPGKMLIFDETTAIVSIRTNSDPSESISMLVKNRELIKMHIAAFDALWEKARKIEITDLEV